MVNLHALALRAVNLELLPKGLVVELVGELHFFCEVVIIVGDYNILDALKIASLKVVDVLGSEGMVEAVVHNMHLESGGQVDCELAYLNLH